MSLLGRMRAFCVHQDAHSLEANDVGFRRTDEKESRRINVEENKQIIRRRREKEEASRVGLLWLAGWLIFSSSSYILTTFKTSKKK